MSDLQSIRRAIRLAEQILDEVTRPQQDWSAVRSMAISLASLADRQTREPRGPEDPSGEQRALGSPRR